MGAYFIETNKKKTMVKLIGSLLFYCFKTPSKKGIAMGKGGDGAKGEGKRILR